MKIIFNIAIIILINFSIVLGDDFNAPVKSSANLSCCVIKPLCINLEKVEDYLNWPIIPLGFKYFFKSSENEDADSRSVFVIKGEAGKKIEIKLFSNIDIDNVEISYKIKGTDLQYVGINSIPELMLSNGSIVVQLNESGCYYLHIVYLWIWAKANALPGEKSFTQAFTISYTNL
jgi:hypothetical protein